MNMVSSHSARLSTYSPFDYSYNVSQTQSVVNNSASSFTQICHSVIQRNEMRIIDINASDHITPYAHLMLCISFFKFPIMVHLPNDSNTRVFHTDTIVLH